MSSDIRRRDARYAIRLPVKLAYGRRELSLATEDVSFRGIFVQTDTPPKLRQLVRIHLVLPAGERAIKLHGMVVHIVEPIASSSEPLEGSAGAGRRRPGVGIQFYALDREARDTWDALIHYVEENCPPAADQAPLTLPENTPEPVRVRFERHTPVVRLPVTSVAQLEEFYASELLNGGAFIRTPLELAAGAPLILQVTHPETDEPFLLDAVVRHRHAQGYFVEFLGLESGRREDLHFVRAGIHIAEELVVDVA